MFCVCQHTADSSWLYTYSASCAQWSHIGITVASTFISFITGFPPFTCIISSMSGLYYTSNLFQNGQWRVSGYDSNLFSSKKPQCKMEYFSIDNKNINNSLHEEEKLIDQKQLVPGRELFKCESISILITFIIGQPEHVFLQVT